MHEDGDNRQSLPADLSARLWAIEHVLEHVVIWYWRVRSEAGYGDWLDDAKTHVEGSGLAGVNWAFDQGLIAIRPSDLTIHLSPEAMRSSHLKRLRGKKVRDLHDGTSAKKLLDKKALMGRWSAFRSDSSR